MSRSQKVFLALLKPLLKLLVSWEVRGRGNVPLTGPVIVVANHVHALDPILLILSFPRWISFMAKEELFRYPILKIIIHWGKAFMVPRRGTVGEKRETIREAKDILNDGMALGMFPEGKRSREAKLLPARTGAAVIASQMDAPLLPIAIIGTEKFKGISWLWRRPRVVINIGQPFKLPSVNGRLTRSQIKLLSNSMMEEIAALLPPENRGTYGD